MRLRTLELERFGPFTGKTLSFRPDAKLHVVFGPNEAGKSCALAAVTDLFFGIKDTSYDFCHSAKDLRIGAEIEARDGARLAFRRKKYKSKLTSPADAPLPDDALAPFLGGLTPEVFCRAFGLNATSLRKGAEEMLGSEGDIGATLLAASSGLSGLTELRRTLEAEAKGIFDKTRSKDRRFYQALDRFDVARSAIGKRELKARDWKEINARIDELAAQKDGINRRRDEAVVEHARLARLKRLGPLIARLDADMRAIAELGDLPDVPAGFVERLRSALDATQSSRDDLTRRKNEEDNAGRDHAAIVVDAALLAREPEIHSLFAGTGAYAKARTDLPRIEAESAAYETALAEVAARLGLSSAAELEGRQPPDAAKSLVRGLSAEGRGIREDVSSKQRLLADERRSLDRLQREQTERGALVDPKPLRDRFDALSPVLKDLERRSDLMFAVAQETRRLVEAASRLQPPVTDLEALAVAALPSSATVARFRADLDASAETSRREADMIAAATEAKEVAARRLQSLTFAGPVASREAIGAARSGRDELWLKLRATLSGGPDALAGPALATTITRFESLTAEADRLSDSAFIDAQRIVDHANEARNLAEETRKETEARARAADAESRLAALHAAWQALWGEIIATPRPPADMLVWLNAAAGLIERREQLQSSRHNLALLEERIGGIAPALHALAADLGLAPMASLDAGLLAGAVETALTALREAWDDARDHAARLRDSQGRVEALSTSVAEAERLQADWSARWGPAVAAIGLGPEATPEQADAVLLAWDEVLSTIRERDNRDRRVSGMHRDARDFESAVAALAATVAPDLQGYTAEAAAKALNSRLGAAKEVQARRSETARLLAQAEQARDAMERTAAQAEQNLAEVAAALPAGTDLEAMCERLASRAGLADAVAEKRRQIAELSDGVGEAAIRRDLQSFDPDQAEAALHRLAQEQQSLAARSNEVFADHRDAEMRRSELEGGVGAEIAVQERRNAEAELAAAAREWAVLRIAGLLLGEAMESHRAGQQDPLMARAGALFATVTAGAFAGLVQDYDENDAPRLAGRRPSGEIVPVAGLSEGSRDQLYLALRLAYLEDYAQRAEPAPFIGDDLFATFDDRRTIAGLNALAAIGDHVQPILFTHHRHVADAASATLGNAVEVLELG